MLQMAAQGDSAYSVFYFRNLGHDMNTRDINGRTPLHWACLKASYQAFQYLMPCNVDVNARDCIGKTPLHYAAQTSVTHRNDYLVTKLILKGADINARDRNGQTPFLVMTSTLDSLN